MGALLIPAVSFAQNPGQRGYYILKFNCTGLPIAGTASSGGGSGERTCNFKDFMVLIDRIINLLLYVATILAVISFVYAGFKLLFSGGNEDAIKHAKFIFINVLIGLVLAYGAWLIVRFVLTTLGVKRNQDYTFIEGIN